MGLEAEYHVTCDYRGPGCRKQLEVDEPPTTRKAAILAARADGWIYENYVMACPPCYKQAHGKGGR